MWGQEVSGFLMVQMLSQPLPATIVTGFLGAGKTTLLNHLLTNSPHGLRVGALVNEFGAVDIDSSLLVSERAISSGVVELANGCICCTINDSLCDAVTELLKRRSDIDHLLIETTGVADPQPVLDTLRLPQFVSAVRVDAVVTVIDGTSVDRRLAAESCDTSDHAAKRAAVDPSAECERLQLAAADMLVVNKSDLLSTAQVKRVRAWLGAAAPQARQLQCQHGRVPPEVILSAEVGARAHRQSESSETLVGGDPAGALPSSKSGMGAPRPLPSSGPAAFEWASRRGPSDHLAADGFISVSFRSARPLRLLAFEGLRRSSLWCENVVRAKGFLAFEECPDYRITLQQCGPRVDARVAADDRQDGNSGCAARRGWTGAILMLHQTSAVRLMPMPTTTLIRCTLVMIGQGLDEQRLLDGLRACEARDAAFLAELCEEVEEEPASPTSVADGYSGAPHPPLSDDAHERVAALADTFAQCVARDQRFEMEGVQRFGDEGALVRFRLLGWFGVEGDELSMQLLNAANTSGTGVSWLAPCRRELALSVDGKQGDLPNPLVLVQTLCLGVDDARSRWADVQKAAEGIMLAHFGGFFCGKFSAEHAGLVNPALA